MGSRDDDRRDTARRAEVVRRVLEDIVQGAAPVVTVDSLRASLPISEQAAARILEHLVSAGLLVEIRPGVWVRVVR